LAIVECGAGKAIPTVRSFCENRASSPPTTLIRINPHEPLVPAPHLAIPVGALEGLKAIDRLLMQGIS
jgi:hypothetical protein